MINYTKPIKLALIVIISFINLFQCRNSNFLEVKVKEFHQKWIHSYEEDFDEYIVFRNSDFELPPAKDRVFFEFFLDGTLNYGSIEQNAEKQSKNGSWKKISPNTIEVIVNRQTIKIQIINLEKDKLIIKYINN